MLVLGIDPGLAHCGLAWLDIAADGSERLSVRCLRGPRERRVRSKADGYARLAQWLGGEMRAASAGIRRGSLIYRPDVVCAEELTWPPGARGGGLLGMAWGCLCTAFAETPLVLMPTREARLHALGRRDCSKGDVEEWARSRWPAAGWSGLRSEAPHQADAAIVAWATARHAPEVRLLRGTL